MSLQEYGGLEGRYTRKEEHWGDAVLREIAACTVVWVFVPQGCSTVLLRTDQTSYTLISLGASQAVRTAKSLFVSLLCEANRKAKRHWQVKWNGCHDSLMSLAIARRLFSAGKRQRELAGFLREILPSCSLDGLESAIEQSVLQALHILPSELELRVTAAQQRMALKYLQSYGEQPGSRMQSPRFAIGPHLLATSSRLASTSSESSSPTELFSPSIPDSSSLQLSDSPQSRTSPHPTYTDYGLQWPFLPPENRAFADCPDTSKLWVDELTDWRELVYVESKEVSEGEDTVKDDICSPPTGLLTAPEFREITGLRGELATEGTTLDSPKRGHSSPKFEAYRDVSVSSAEHTEMLLRSAPMQVVCGPTCTIL